MRRRALLGATAALLGPQAFAATPFGREPRDLLRPPRLREIALPDFPGAHAIWGSTGDDRRGNIWVGVSATGQAASAHLMEIDPTTSCARDRGGVLDALARLRPLRPDEAQTKIHSRIVQADDGWLYFASTDETGEAKGVLPRWGSHLWRVRPGEGRWEHVLEVPEEVIAVAGHGNAIHMLGLWDHVLYRHDTASGQTKRVVVGAPAGHMSRNFVVDRNGHAYVPRVTFKARRLEAMLVEYTPMLEVVGETPLAFYGDDDPESAGITAFVELADGAIVIATSVGYLYRITPRVGGASVLPLGWLHPAGPAYPVSLFTWDGVGHVCGLARSAENIRPNAPWPDFSWDWVVYDLERRIGQAQVFPHGDLGRPPLLYGSATRDDQGRFYLGGRRHLGDALRPVLWQVDTL